MLTGVLLGLSVKSMLEGLAVTLAGTAVVGGAAGIWKLSMQVGELVAHMAALRSEVKQDVKSLSDTWENYRQQVELHIGSQRELAQANKESMTKDVEYVRRAIQEHEERIRSLEGSQKATADTL